MFPATRFAAEPRFRDAGAVAEETLLAVAFRVTWAFLSGRFGVRVQGICRTIRVRVQGNRSTNISRLILPRLPNLAPDSRHRANFVRRAVWFEPLVVKAESVSLVLANREAGFGKAQYVPVPWAAAVRFSGRCRRTAGGAVGRTRRKARTRYP